MLESTERTASAAAAMLNTHRQIAAETSDNYADLIGSLARITICIASSPLQAAEASIEDWAALSSNIVMIGFPEYSARSKGDLKKLLTQYKKGIQETA
jgi:hypothetical protein